MRSPNKLRQIAGKNLQVFGEWWSVVGGQQGNSLWNLFHTLCEKTDSY